MSEGGVREKSLLEELESLDLDQPIKDRLVKKYWDEIERNRAEIERVRAETYEEVTGLVGEVAEKSIIISVLSAYIKGKGLL